MPSAVQLKAPQRACCVAMHPESGEVLVGASSLVMFDAAGRAAEP